MEKILISWLAHAHDFTRIEGKHIEANREGSPNYQFHEHFYDHDRHIILHTEQDEIPAAKLRTELVKDFPKHKVELIQIPVPDPIDLSDIKPKVEAELMKLKGNEIDIFFSPGTSIMQVSWFICHTNLGLKTKLVQTRAAKFTKTGKPGISYIESELSTIPISAVLREKSESRPQGDTIGELYLTPTIKKVYERAYKIAQTDHVPVLIIGESGTGKENLARYIHENSPRKNQPYLAVNCSSLSDQLLESRLFGYLKGSFTGADSDKTGIFESVNKGTLFLDEIGDISPYMQQSLLRVLQEGTFLQVGSNKEKKTNVRIIAATNKNLKQLCKEGRFRWDLYYRLSVIDIEVPGLAHYGPGEIEELFEYFLSVKQKILEKSKRLQPAKEVIQAIKNYPFPGNIRELENLTEKLYVFCDENVEISDLPEHIIKPEEYISFRINDIEKTLIEKVLKIKQYNQRQTQLTIGYKSINTLRSKIIRYGIKNHE